MEYRRPKHSELLFQEKFINPVDQGDSDPDFNDGVLSSPHRAYSPFVEGTVRYADPASMTATVELDSGNTIDNCRIGSPYIGPHGDGASTVPAPGARCVVLVGLSDPVIICYVAEGDVQNTNQDHAKLSSITAGSQGFGADDPTYKSTDGTTNYRGGRTDQLIPGDPVVFEAPEGNLLAVLRGLTILKGSEISQVIVSQLGGLVRIVSNLFQHYNAAGTIEIRNDNGRTSMSLKAGSDSKETGEVAPTVHLEVGASGELVELRVTEEDGEEQAKYHISPDGRITTKVRSVTSRVDENKVDEVIGNSTRSVDGEEKKTVTGSSTQRYGETYDVLAQNVNLTASGNLTLRAQRDLSQVIGGRLFQSIQKDTEIFHYGPMSRDFTLQDYKLTISAPGKTANLCTFTLDKTGGIELTSRARAKIGGDMQTTITGNSVLIGQGAKLPVIRNTDLLSLADAVLATITSFGAVVGGKVVITVPAGASPIAAVVPTLGSKIVLA